MGQDKTIRNSPLEVEEFKRGIALLPVPHTRCNGVAPCSNKGIAEEMDACPNCGSDEIYEMKSRPKSSTRPGLKKCRVCRNQFSDSVGTIFHGSHIPVEKRAALISLLNLGFSVLSVSKALSLTYVTTHRYAVKINSPGGVNLAAIMMGRKGGVRGGPARAKALSPEDRKKIAMQAISSRWQRKGINIARIDGGATLNEVWKLNRKLKETIREHKKYC